MNSENNIENLINKYEMYVKKLVGSIVKYNSNIDDITQETFIKVYEKLDVLDKDKNIKNYIGIIASNTTRDYIRKANMLKEAYCDDWSFLEEKQIIDIYDDESEDDFRKKYVESLPVHYGLVIDCLFFKDMSVRETARYLGINQNTVRSRLCKGKRKLKTICKV